MRQAAVGGDIPFKSSQADNGDENDGDEDDCDEDNCYDDNDEDDCFEIHGA